jgi:CBS domain-containing protein
MLTVSALLDAKGHEIFWVEKDTTVLKTLEVMAEKKIGAVLVMDEGDPAGIFSERDFARMVAHTKTPNLDLPVETWITRDIFCCSPSETLDEVMALMTNKRIRHLPVCGGSKFIGLISIGDVVKALIEDKDLLIDNMEKYILGRGYGQ